MTDRMTMDDACPASCGLWPLIYDNIMCVDNGKKYVGVVLHDNGQNFADVIVHTRDVVIS